MLRLGRYEIEAEIGQGSMGVVYLANDPRVRRRLALKTYLLPHGLSREEEREFSERFLREAQAAGALSHPAIVTVYDADEDPAEGIPFIAMEYVPGRSLRQVLTDEGRLAPERAFAIAATLADALHAAHEAGIVHRDVKPANILVREPDGAVKIADFGVARLPTSELTRSGLSFGSPAYMAPEQFRGAPVDRRSDLFSLAVILYQSLSGERPFGGSDLMSIAYSVVNEKPIPITHRVESLSPAIDTFFERALAKDPDERYQTGEEFKRALEATQSGGFEAQSDLAAADVASSSSAPAVAAPAAQAAKITPKKHDDVEVRFRARAFGIAILLLVVALVCRGIFFGFHKDDPAPAESRTSKAATTSAERGGGAPSSHSGATPGPGSTGSISLHADSSVAARNPLAGSSRTDSAPNGRYSAGLPSLSDPASASRGSAAGACRGAAP